MKLPKLFVPLSILVLFLFGSSGLLSANEIQNHQALFNEMIGGGQWTPSEDPTIVRAKRVYINYDILVSNPQQLPTAVSDTAGSLVLNLFDDVVLTAVLDTLDSTIPEFFSWIGHIEGIKQSNVTLVIGEGMVQGSITMPDAFYQISHVGNGVHAIYEIDQAAFPTELDPIPVDSPDNAIAFDMISADDGSVIDVIVFYTEKARIAAGGSDNITAQILKAKEDANIGYANSGVIQTIHLIDPYAYDAEVRYDETNFDWVEALTRLRENGDGYMDEVHELRDRYNADIVVLIVDNQDSCGASYSMKTLSVGFAPYAFSLVSRNCSVNNYSLAHELGHVMGSQHDHGNANIDGVYPYSYGYQDPAGVFRTIMAYDCPGGCVRVNYWSNPDVQYNGQPMGVAEGDSMAADNRKSLNNTRSIVANFRSSTGSLTVTLGPPEAVSAGAQWRVDGGAWRNSGYIQSGLAVGSHAVAFRDDVAGWTAPENQSVTIAGGQTATTRGTYVQQTGSLTVTLTPAAAVAAGARWRIKGDSTWRDGGYIQSGIVVGSYTVEFRGVSGWTAPGDKPVQITNAGMTTTSGTYVQQTGSLTVTLGPDAAISAGARWRIRGDSTWRDGGYIQSGIVVGSYTVEFRDDVPGWTAPGNKTVQITNGETTAESGTYTVIPADDSTGSLKVTLSPPEAVSAGAKWRVDGGDWFNSDYTQPGLTTGSHTVEFSAVPGWTAPDNQSVTIGNGENVSASGSYTPLATGEDSDQDGISDDEEAEGPNGGDGNGDGIADSRQAYVATLRTADADMITLETSAGVNIRNCRAVDTFSTGSVPTEVEFPHGLFEFSLVGVDPGGAVSVTLHLPDGETADVYYKFGPTADDGGDHWYDFTHDGQTGAEIDGNRITFHFIDGQRGDDDLVANGTIVDIGGPGISTVTTGGGSSDIQNDSGSGGGGGGCFIGTIRR
jgi:hypothetical protein